MSYGGQCHVFSGDEEGMKIPGTIADSSGLSPKPGSDLGPWNCSR